MQLVIGPAEGREAGALLALVLAWAVMVDVDRRLLPDPLTLGLCLLGLARAWTMGPAATLDAAVGAAAGFGSLATLGAAYRRWRGRDGLGRGDAKLAAAAGAWLGWRDLPTLMLIASLAGLLFVLAAAAMHKRKLSADSAIAFGPFIALGIWTLWLLRPA